MKLEIVAVDHHRNGVSGTGFWAILFIDRTPDVENEGRLMVASVFPAKGSCAVYNVDELKNRNIMMGCGNSWRGDYYEADLRKAIKEYQGKRGY